MGASVTPSLDVKICGSLPVLLSQTYECPCRFMILAGGRQFASVRRRPVFVRHRDPSPSLEVHTDHVLHSIFSFRGDQRPEVTPL